MFLSKQVAAFSALGFLVAGNLSYGAENNPKLGSETYYGSGYVERAPEYGEASFTFNVSCLKTAEAVQKAIEKKSLPIWKSIISKISDFTETDRHFWGDVKGITGEDDSRLTATAPSTDSAGKFHPGTLKRYSTCDNKVELPVNSPVGKIYKGSQTISVRSSDLDWLESLVRTVQKQPQGEQKGEVKISASSIRYDVTEGTKRDMRVEVQKQARLAATGPGSKFEKDKTTLKFASAHFLGQHLEAPPHQSLSFLTPIEKGKAPVVSIELPFAYTIYAEAGDRVNNGPAVVGLTSNYLAVGRKISKADFGRTVATVSATCAVSPEKAADLIKTEAAAVQKEFQTVQAATPASQTDRVEVGEPSVTIDYPYAPQSWSDTLDENKRSYLVLTYFDKCTGKVIPAPATGELTPYYGVTQQLSLKTTNFAALTNTIESLRTKYGVSPASATAATVVVGDAVADVTDATKQKLLQEAREDAAACILDPAGSLAGDVSGNKFTCVHLKNFRIAQESFRNKSGGIHQESARAASPMAFDAPGGRGEPPLEVVIVKKDGDLRGRIGVAEQERHYAFQFQFQTEDYAPLLKGRAATLP